MTQEELDAIVYAGMARPLTPEEAAAGAAASAGGPPRQGSCPVRVLTAERPFWPHVGRHWPVTPSANDDLV